MPRLVRETLAGAIEILRASGVETPRLDAEILLGHVIGRTRLEIIAHPDMEIPESHIHAFQAVLDKRAKRCPLAYLVGHREFYGLEIEVGDAVLVPRPETELLVEETIRRVGSGLVRIADIGTGSGAIAVALAASLPDASLYATDISPAALEVAGHNVAKHHLSDRVKLIEGDLCEPLAGLEFDAIVSNPPYIPTGDIPDLQAEVARWEPPGALDGGPDGLDAIRRLLPAAKDLLKAGGFAALEVGAGQADAVTQIARAAGYSETEVERDLARIDRVMVCLR